MLHITKGVNINCKELAFTDLILYGYKTIETRKTNSLKCLVGKRVAIIKTGLGKATIVGFCTIGEPKIYKTIKAFNEDRNLHRVPKNSSYWIKKGSVKYGYPLIDVRPCYPRQIESKGYVIRNINLIIEKHEEIFGKACQKLSRNHILNQAKKDEEKPFGYVITWLRDNYGLPKTIGWEITQEILDFFKINYY